MADKLKPLTVDDIVKAQIRSRENVDPNKCCDTCLHKDKGVGVMPCKRCFNSFMGIMLNPSEWVKEA